MHDLIHALPKVELHMHIEGALQPEMMFMLARRNAIELDYPSVEALRAAYEFRDLQSFLDLYYRGVNVLRTEVDFFDLTWSYLVNARAQNVRHAELFFDPQAHTARGVRLGTVINGIHAALAHGRRTLGISSHLILCFLRHLHAAQAMQTLEEALPYRGRFIAVGLDSSERGNPPERFAAVFRRARAAGLRAVAHAGEEGPPDYIRQALDRLGAVRIDHGVRCTEDPRLVARLAGERIPLTVCPLSNVKVRVFPTLAQHNLATLLRQGVRVTVNSDDPAYFGGYIEENLLATQQALRLTPAELVQLARNAIDAAFLDGARRRTLHSELERVAIHHGVRPARVRAVTASGPAAVGAAAWPR